MLKIDKENIKELDIDPLQELPRMTIVDLYNIFYDNELIILEKILIKPLFGESQNALQETFERSKEKLYSLITDSGYSFKDEDDCIIRKMFFDCEAYNRFQRHMISNIEFLLKEGIELSGNNLNDSLTNIINKSIELRKPIDLSFARIVYGKLYYSKYINSPEKDKLIRNLIKTIPYSDFTNWITDDKNSLETVLLKSTERLHIYGCHEEDNGLIIDEVLSSKQFIQLNQRFIEIPKSAKFSIYFNQYQVRYSDSLEDIDTQSVAVETSKNKATENSEKSDILSDEIEDIEIMDVFLSYFKNDKITEQPITIFISEVENIICKTMQTNDVIENANAFLSITKISKINDKLYDSSKYVLEDYSSKSIVNTLAMDSMIIDKERLSKSNFREVYHNLLSSESFTTRYKEYISEDRLNESMSDVFLKKLEKDNLVGNVDYQYLQLNLNKYEVTCEVDFFGLFRLKAKVTSADLEKSRRRVATKVIKAVFGLEGV